MQPLGRCRKSEQLEVCPEIVGSNKSGPICTPVLLAGLKPICWISTVCFIIREGARPRSKHQMQSWECSTAGHRIAAPSSCKLRPRHVKTGYPQNDGCPCGFPSCGLKPNPKSATNSKSARLLNGDHRSHHISMGRQARRTICRRKQSSEKRRGPGVVSRLRTKAWARRLHERQAQGVIWTGWYAAFKLCLLHGLLLLLLSLCRPHLVFWGLASPFGICDPESVPLKRQRLLCG